jgi:ABC-2 type transport system ATP-binding protein
MLQRLGFAQALIGNPKYLLLDEPASGVDPGGVLLLRRLMKDLRKSGLTILLNSHQLDQVEKLCDRVAFIKSGQVEAIEDLQYDQAEEQRFLIRWRRNEQSPSESELRAILDAARATGLHYESDNASFNVASVDSIPSIIKEMVLKGYAIIQAGPQDNRLERYFVPGQSVNSDKAPEAE